TRPSMISGQPVSSETSRTLMPAAAIAEAVPPVETMSTPSDESTPAKSVIPVLSETESSARRTATRSGTGTFFETTVIGGRSPAANLKGKIRGLAQSWPESTHRLLQACRFRQSGETALRVQVSRQYTSGISDALKC